jgi:cobalamin biosynthesis Mg chelatase CobN
MKLNESFPKDWHIILFGAIMFFLIMQACTTAKEISQVKITGETDYKVKENTNASSQAQTNTKTKKVIETETTEDCDTTVNVWVDVPGTNTKEQVPVNVKVRKTTTRKEFTDQDQQKKESGTTSVDRKEQRKANNTQIAKEKTVERTGLSFWSISIIVLLILAGAAALLWRLKVF